MQRGVQIIAAFFVLAFCSTASAQFALEPGQRIKGHAKLDCTKCHAEGSGISKNKCMSCHEHRPLGSRIKAKKGLHGRAKFTRQSCETCHQDHKGRNYNPIDWSSVGSKKRFNHDLTGYELEGAHRRVKCKECHTSKYKSKRIKYLGLDDDCLTCHEDVHRFQRSQKSLLDCKICHSFDARIVTKSPNRFNHGKVSKFALKGKHKSTRCTNCHASTKSFKILDKPDKCVDCHKDIHKNVYTLKSRDCSACHTDRKTKFTSSIPNWNHVRTTGFSLSGGHGNVDCVKCHEKTSKSVPSGTCLSCHKRDSAHVVAGKDRFKGRDCGQCHSAKTFKKRVPFKHGRNTGFALGGKHGSVGCTDCHRKKADAKSAKRAEDTFEFFASQKCIGCHAHTNDHNGKFNDRPKLCVKCHVPGSKNIKTPNHRELTPKFAQQGAHKPVACDKCHGKALTNLNPGADCAACHKDDDVHAGNLGETCKQCHLEGFPWSDVLFQHNVHAEYKLEGKHQAVACNRCHTASPKVFKPTTQKCYDCHKQQDVHETALGQDCGSCHDARGSTAQFDHNSMTDYVLDGAHARADCAGCHFKGDPKVAEIDLKFVVQGSECRDCHGDPHGLRAGASCNGCHDTESFFNARSRVGSGDDDSAATKTKQNSKSSKKKKGKSVPNPDGGPNERAMFEGSNHGPRAGAKGSDPSAGVPDESLPATTPAASTDDASPFGGILSIFRGSGRPVDPYHDHPPFSLRDGHARVDCNRCHGGRGDLQGLGMMCDTCHKTRDIHAGSLGPMCGDCHRQRAFAPAYFSHTKTGFSLVASHRLLSCKQCHAAGQYQGLSGDCVGCHLDDAVRGGRNHLGDGKAGQPCALCHNQVSWQVGLIRRRF